MTINIVFREYASSIILIFLKYGIRTTGKYEKDHNIFMNVKPGAGLSNVLREILSHEEVLTHIFYLILISFG